jgi:glutathione S-transferase
VIEAVRLKGAEHELVMLAGGEHNAIIEEIYGEGNRTAPGITIDGRSAHGSRAALDLLEQVVPEPALYPEERGEEIREAERWGDEELQDLGRWFTWGAMYFRPEYFGTFFGGEDVLDPAGTDHAIRFVRAAWRYHGLDAVKLAEGLAAFPAKLDHVDELISEGLLDGERPNAADLQIGATLRVILNVADIAPLNEGRPAGRMARRWFSDYDGSVPPNALPAGWVPG